MSELLTPTEVRRLLDRHGLAPRRSDGQNFVTDPNTIRKLIRDAGVRPTDLVLEIGPGLGSLTLALVAAAAEVVAVEVDAGLVRALEETLGGEQRVSVVHADALAVDLDEVVGHRPARLVANLPYNVATPIVMTALATASVTDLFVMVQREVGERWASRPGDDAYGAVSAKIAFAADVEVVAAVPRAVFHPVPNVDSATVRLSRHHLLTPAECGAANAVVDAAFASRRKTLRNNLRPLAPDIEARLEAVGIDPGARAEQLDPVQHLVLAAALDAVSDEAVSRLRHRGGVG